MSQTATIELSPSLRVTWPLEDLRDGLDTGPIQGPWSIDGPLAPGFSALRVFTGLTERGRLLLVAAARPADVDGHDAEIVHAILLDRSGEPAPLEEALVSTQYTADGQIARIGLELYRESEDYPLRGAGDAIDAFFVSDSAHPHRVARLDFRLDGEGGTALYEIVEP